MKAALVFPGISESGFNRTGSRLPFTWVHHGLASLGANMKKERHQVDCIDLRQLAGWDEYRAKVAELKPRVLGITMMSVDYDNAIHAARIAKELDPQLIVVVGGPHPTLMPDEVASHGCIDHIVLGEGEISLNDLLKDIDRGIRPERIITGVMPDLDSLPFIDRGLFGAEEVVIDGFLPRPFVTLIAGRGCLYNCSFCQPAERTMFGKKVRRRSVTNVIGEMKALRDKYRFNSFMLHDDCLTEDEAWVREFCGSYEREKFRKPFVCQSRADIVCKNENMARSLKRAGCAMMMIGFESGSQRVLNFLRKGTTVEQNYAAAAICGRLGIRVWANFMLGIPTETNEDALATLRMIRMIKPYRASPSFFTPHPGSDLYTYCEERGLSLIRDHSSYSRSPLEPKIRGVDYEYLRWVLEESTKIPLSVKLKRKTDSIGKKIRRHFAKRAVSQVASYQLSDVSEKK